MKKYEFTMNRFPIAPKTAYVLWKYTPFVYDILQAIPKSSIVYVVEPCTPLINIKLSSRLILLDGTRFREVAAFIAIDTYKKGLTGLCPAPDLPRELVVKIMESARIQYDTEKSMESLWRENIKKNTPYILANPSLEGFKGQAKRFPAIIVSAGPSLMQNIELLPDVKNRAAMITSGSAQAALTLFNIQPTFAVFTDAGESVLDDCYPNPETIALFNYQVYHGAPRIWIDRKYFFEDKPELRPEGLPQGVTLQSNISVASSALAFALYMDADPVIFVGQDCSYPEGCPHHAEGVKPFPYNEKNTVNVPGYYGKLVKTNIQFKDLIEYFETFPIRYPQKTFINATEGGARIQGFQQRRLKEVIKGVL